MPAAVAVGPHEILQRQRRLAEELGRPLVLQHQKLALDGSDCGLGDVAEGLRGLSDRRQRVFLGIGRLFSAVRNDRVQQRPQIFHVDQGQPVLVRDAERDIEDAFLHVVQIEHARQQQRPHFGDGGPHRMPLLAENIPENRRELVGLERETHIVGPFEDKILGLPGLGDAGEVTLDVGGEYRHAGTGKSFGHHLQRDGFPGSGGAGDEAVAVCKPERQPGLLLALADEDLLASIGQFVFGRSHCIASSRAWRNLDPGQRHPSACCEPIETAQRLNAVPLFRCLDRGNRGECTCIRESRLTLALLQHSAASASSDCGDRLYFVARKIKIIPQGTIRQATG